VKVIIKPKAEKSMVSIGDYISEKGYPETADNYIDRLKAFALGLSVFPDKYPLCRFPHFAKRNLHCAVFENTYTFVYKAAKDKLVVYNVIHGMRLK